MCPVMCDSLLVFLATVLVAMLAMPLNAIGRLVHTLLEDCSVEVLNSVATLCEGFDVALYDIGGSFAM